MTAPVTRPAFADSTAEHAPTFRLDEKIAEARAAMGEKRWQKLNAEWSEP